MGEAGREQVVQALDVPLPQVRPWMGGLFRQETLGPSVAASPGVSGEPPCPEATDLSGTQHLEGATSELGLRSFCPLGQFVTGCWTMWSDPAGLFWGPELFGLPAIAWQEATYPAPVATYPASTPQGSFATQIQHSTLNQSLQLQH